MKTKTFNRGELAKAYGVSVQTVDAWVRRGCPHTRRGARRDYVFRLDQVAPWRAHALAEDSQRGNGSGRRVIPDGAREWLDQMFIPYCHALPWTIDKPEFAEVKPSPERDRVLELIVTVDEYKREVDSGGIDDDEFLLRILFGLPTMPPAPNDPKKRPRISLPHAGAWLLMFSGFVENLGGNGLAKRVACEAQRLRGYPVPDLDDDAGDGDGAAASP